MPRKITTIKDQVYEILKQDICSGYYKPGHWMQEMELAGTLEVSRSPVRDALHQLAKDGLVVEIPNKGVFVRRITEKDIDEIFQIRSMFESEAISHIIDHWNEKAEQRLKEVRELFLTSYDARNAAKYTEVDDHFHRILIELTGNEMMLGFYDSARNLCTQVRIYALSSEGRLDKSYEEHVAIIDEIMKGNKENAIRMIREHLEVTKKSTLMYLESSLEEEESGSGQA